MTIETVGTSATNNLTGNLRMELGPQIWSNHLDPLQTQVSYSFGLGVRSSLSATLQNLSADADLVLRDGAGATVAAARNPDGLTEALSATLDPGTYSVQVVAKGPLLPSDRTDYQLRLEARSVQSPELLWWHDQTGATAIWSLQGSEIDQGRYLAEADPQWQLAGSGDFNTDGQADLVWRNVTTGENRIALMNGDQSQSRVTLLTVADPAWYIVASGDFNQDQQSDLLWHHRNSGETAVWFLKAGQFQSGVFLAPQSDRNWQLAATADLNQDGHGDLLWRNYQTGANQVWWMRGTEKIGSADLDPAPDVNWQLVGTGDLNHDGHCDLLWRNPVTGENGVWYLQSATFQSADGLRPTEGHRLLSIPDAHWHLVGSQAHANEPLTLAGSIRETALNLGTLKTSGSYQSQLSAAHPRDFYQFHLDARQSVTVRTTALSWAVTDRSGQLLATGGVPTAASMPITATVLEAGDYWVQVASNLAPPLGATDYRLDLSVTALNPVLVAGGLNPALSGGAAKSTAGLAQDATALDLVATSLVARRPGTEGSPLAPGSSIAVEGQLLNSGMATGTAVQVGFYLVRGSGPVTTTSRLLGTQTLAAMAAQTSRTVSQTLTLPVATDPIWQGDGAYTLGMIVDPTNAVREVNEQNNLATTGLAVTVPKVYRYDFIYYYSGVVSASAGGPAGGTAGGLFGGGAGSPTAVVTPMANQADYYKGYVYGNADRYQANTYVDYNPNPNAAQTNGRYWITQVTQAGTAAEVGQVTVTQYYDGDTNSLVNPASGKGSQDIGSEVGYLNAVARNEERFGQDYYAADRLLTRPLDPQAALGQLSGDATLDALLNHDASGNVSYWNTSSNGGMIPYSFYQPTSGVYSGRETVAPVSEAIKTNVRNLLAELEMTINVRFVEVADTATNPGVLRYLFSNGGGAAGFYAYAYYPGQATGSDVHLSSAYASEFAKAPGSYGYKTLVHETLHALGLKHPGNYNAGGGGSSAPYLTGAEDNSTNTIMTYNLAGSYPVTPMKDDLRALQYLYGARVETANNTYRFTSLSQYSVDGRSIGSRSGNLVKQTLWDGGGGQDTLDFTALPTASYRFDLNPGGILTQPLAYNSVAYDDVAGGGRYQTSDYGTVLASGTLIENIINSRGNDDILLNSASNQVLGYGLGNASGNDVIQGATSQDTVVLAGYRLSDLTPTLDGSDLRLQLAQNGSILLKNYFAGVRVLLDGALYVYAPPPSPVNRTTAAADGSWQIVPGGSTAAQVATQIMTPIGPRTALASTTAASTAAVPTPVAPTTPTTAQGIAGSSLLGLTATAKPTLQPLKLATRATDHSPVCDCSGCRVVNLSRSAWLDDDLGASAELTRGCA
jgi:CARDB/FG-GAP-like repeat